MTDAARPSGRRPKVYFILLALIGAAALLLGLHVYSSREDLKSSLTGVWTGEVRVAGTWVDISMTFEKKGDDVSGTIVAQPGPENNMGQLQELFDHVQVDRDGNFSFAMTVMQQTVTFTGKISPHAKAMKGRIMTADYGEGTWSVKKQS